MLQLSSEFEPLPEMEQEEIVNETRLVPQDYWEEEPIERIEHRTVVEDRKVPQVKSLYAFQGQGMNMAKGNCYTSSSHHSIDNFFVYRWLGSSENY